MCSKKAPKPDPLIGQAAMSNAELAKEQTAVAREQLAWEKDRAARQDPLIAQIAQQQIDTSNKNTARSDDQWNQYKSLFQPLEQQMVEDANNWDSPERQARMAAEAGADVTTGYGAARDQNQRSMERMGVNPNSGKFQAISNETNIAQAKDTAGAMNQARRATEQQGIALRTGAAQFGRNMPNTGIAADSLSLNGGNAAVGNMATGGQMHNQGMQTAGGLFGGGVNANSSSGNLALGQYQGQLEAWNQQNQNNLGMMQGVGNLAGTLGGAAIFAGLRKGGVIKNGTAYGLSSMPYASKKQKKPKGYAAGGMIEGPGTGASDSIPADIEGKEAISLSNGEAVLNAEAVQIVGEPFIHNMNAAGLAMASKAEPQQPGGLQRRIA